MEPSEFDPYAPHLRKHDLLDFMYRYDSTIVLRSSMKVQDLRDLAYQRIQQGPPSSPVTPTSRRRSSNISTRASTASPASVTTPSASRAQQKTSSKKKSPPESACDEPCLPQQLTPSTRVNRKQMVTKEDTGHGTEKSESPTLPMVANSKSTVKSSKVSNGKVAAARPKSPTKRKASLKKEKTDAKLSPGVTSPTSSPAPGSTSEPPTLSPPFNMAEIAKEPKPIRSLLDVDFTKPPFSQHNPFQSGPTPPPRRKVSGKKACNSPAAIIDSPGCKSSNSCLPVLVSGSPSDSQVNVSPPRVRPSLAALVAQANNRRAELAGLKVIAPAEKPISTTNPQKPFQKMSSPKKVMFEHKEVSEGLVDNTTALVAPLKGCPSSNNDFLGSPPEPGLQSPNADTKPTPAVVQHELMSLQNEDFLKLSPALTGLPHPLLGSPSKNSSQCKALGASAVSMANLLDESPDGLDLPPPLLSNDPTPKTAVSNDFETPHFDEINLEGPEVTLSHPGPPDSQASHTLDEFGTKMPGSFVERPENASDLNGLEWPSSSQANNLALRLFKKVDTSEPPSSVSFVNSLFQRAQPVPSTLNHLYQTRESFSSFVDEAFHKLRNKISSSAEIDHPDNAAPAERSLDGPLYPPMPSISANCDQDQFVIVESSEGIPSNVPAQTPVESLSAPVMHPMKPPPGLEHVTVLESISDYENQHPINPCNSPKGESNTIEAVVSDTISSQSPDVNTSLNSVDKIPKARSECILALNGELSSQDPPNDTPALLFQELEQESDTVAPAAQPDKQLNTESQETSTLLEIVVEKHANIIHQSGSPDESILPSCEHQVTCSQPPKGTEDPDFHVDNHPEEAITLRPHVANPPTPVLHAPRLIPIPAEEPPVIFSHSDSGIDLLEDALQDTGS